MRGQIPNVHRPSLSQTNTSNAALMQLVIYNFGATNAGIATITALEVQIGDEQGHRMLTGDSEWVTGS